MPVHPVMGKTLTVARNDFSSPRSFENSMIEWPNQVQISPNFVGMITMDL